MVRELARRALRASERLTKTDMVYLAKGGFWLSTGQVAVAVTSFGLSLVMARYVSPETFGSFKFLGSVGAIIGAISLSGMGTVVTRGAARGHGATLTAAARETWRWSWPGISLALGVSAYYAARGNFPYATAVAMIGLALPVTNASSLYFPYLTGLRDFRRGAITWVAVTAASIAATAAAAFFSGSLIALIFGTYVVAAAVTALAYRLTVRARPPEGAADPENRRLGWHLSLLSLADTFVANLDKILVFQFLGPAATATYVFAQGIPEQARGLIKNGAKVVAPKAATSSFAHVRQALGGKMFRFGLLIALGSAAYATAAPVIFSVLFPAYAAAVPYTRALGFGAAAALAVVPVTALAAHGKTRALYLNSAVVGGIRAAAHLALIPVFGLWGAVASTLVGHLAATVVPLVLLRRTS